MANETVFNKGIHVEGVISGSGSIITSGNSDFGDFQFNTHRFTGSLNISGSGTINGDTIITSADTGSLISVSASYVPGSGVDGPVESADSASYVPGSGVDGAVDQAVTASYVDGLVASASYSENSATASYIEEAVSASYVPGSGVDGPVATASVALNVYISQSGQDVTLGDVTADSITAENLYITTVSSSIIYQSGSTKFGDTLDDTHQFTGSVYISGSEFQFNGNDVITTADTASILVDSASYVPGSGVDGPVDEAVTASFALTASYFDGVVESASYAENAGTASIALNVYISQSGQDATLGTITATNIDASGWISASAIVSVNTLDVNGAQYTTNENGDVDTGTEVVDTFTTGGLCSAEWLACVKNVAGGDYRTSKILAVWDNGGTVQFTEYSTRDIGNTNGLDFGVVSNASGVELQATATSNDWEIKVNRITI